MTNVIVTKNGVIEMPGTPEIYFSDEDFEKLLNHPEVAKKLFEFFKGPVCVGRLGKEVGGVYKEIVIENTTELDGKKGELSYYEKLSDKS